MSKPCLGCDMHPSRAGVAALRSKLGIKDGTAALLVGAPQGLDLVVEPALAPYALAMVFCPDRATLVTSWAAVHPVVAAAGRLWVAWPKRSSGLQTDLDEAFVRAHGLAHGRVDVKICAVDATWSALAFVVRIKDR